MKTSDRLSLARRSERGNILFIILLAVALIGMLTAAVQYSSRPDGANIDKETMIVRAGDVQRMADELARGILFIRENGISESDIRFAGPGMNASYGAFDPDPAKNKGQLFHPQGGAAKYRKPPSDVLALEGQNWEFYGNTAIPQVGSNKADLVAVLPNVSQQFCEAVNRLNGLTGQPLDDGTGAGTCVEAGSAARFGSGGSNPVTYDSTPNTMVEASFSKKPALQACVQCSTGYHFYHVLLAR